MCLAGFNTLMATHLVGGFISYKYIGTVSSGNRYKITITSYRDCKPGSIEFAKEIEVCIFKREDNRLYKSVILDRKSLKKVNPVGRTDCPEATQVCLEQAIFEDLIDLPVSSYGYYIKWEVCCRNTQVNLRNNQDGEPDIGQTYQTIIPPTNVKNSSPFFTDVPVPFICVNDTTQINNYAIDPDGDSLVYKMATPWLGASLTTNYPGCTGEPYTPPTPIPPGRYEAGYSGTFPFGASGISQINSRNGITTFLAKQIGNYAVAIDLLEFRNGVLLSSTRLDLQILVINCTPNNKPTIATSSKSFTLIAGEKLCFNVTANDKDNHFINMNGIGDLLTGANGFKGNKATFSNSSGRGTTSSQFCWQTSCDQARDSAYLFTVQATDDGCPSKFTFTNIRITIRPFKATVNVNGPTSACQGSVQDYNLIFNGTPQELTGITYDVNVTNGTVLSKNLSQLKIQWDKNATQGTIEVTPVSQFGCKGPTFKVTVSLIPSPQAPDLQPVDTVCENTAKTYSITPTSGYRYQWWISNGSVLGSSTSNSINITWGTPGIARAKMVQYNQNNCPSDTVYMDVWISKPNTPSVKGRTSVCPNTSNLLYSVVSNGQGSTFKWFVTGGTFTPGAGNNSISVDWGNQGLGMIKVLEINKFGCPSDTGYLAVSKTYSLIGDSISGDTDVCEFTLNQVFKVEYTPGSTYFWNVTGGTITSGQNSHQVIVDWGATGTGSINMYERSYDSVNNRACVSNLVSRTVNIRPYPNANTINGTPEVCQLTGSGIYSINGYPQSKYLWTINGDSSNIQGQGSSSITFPYDIEGTFNLKVVETSQYGCEGQPVSMTVIVHPKPRTTPILGDSVICSPFLTNYKYTTTGFATSKFFWFINGGSSITPGNADNTTVNWSGQQLNSIRVVEVSDFGCIGDTMKLDVFYDNPSLYLKYVTVNPPPKSDNGVDVYWEVINAPRYNNKFFIERRKAGTTEAYVTAGTVNGNVVTFNDGNLLTDSSAWEYRVKGFDLCGKEIYTASHTNILLRGNKTSGYDVTMNFTPYIGWGSSNITYDLYRMLKNSGDYVLYEPNITSFNAAYSNGLEYYTQCYRIKATKVGTDTVTWSNDICFDFDPIIFIPDAFSPNNDDYNEEFFIKGGALKSVEFKVFNRWGEKLFEGDNINARWDGTYKGQDQPQGVYMYYCYYTGFDGKKYSTKGTITLLR